MKRLYWLSILFVPFVSAGASALAAEVGERNAPFLDHIAFVVHDIEQAAPRFADILGVERPPIVTTESLQQTDVCYLGNPTEAAAKLAFLQLENVAIELIEPVAGDSAWKDFLEREGGGIHHVTLRVDELDAGRANLEAEGGKLLQIGSFQGGDYAYVDMAGQLQVVLELLALAPQKER